MFVLNRTLEGLQVPFPRSAPKMLHHSHPQKEKNTATSCKHWEGVNHTRKGLQVPLRVGDEESAACESQAQNARKIASAASNGDAYASVEAYPEAYP